MSTVPTVRRSPRIENSKDAAAAAAKDGTKASKVGMQSKGVVKKRSAAASKDGSKARAYWNAEMEKTLVELLQEHNTPEHKGQNGWSSEVWNRMATKFHEKHPYTDYTKKQVQFKEKELKREYKMIKEARQQSGVSWNEQRCMIEADDALWDNLIVSFPSISKYRSSKSFPLFNSLGDLYDGQLAEGTYNFTSTETQDEFNPAVSSVEAATVHVLDDMGENMLDGAHGGMQEAGDIAAGDIAARNIAADIAAGNIAAPSRSIDNEPKKRRTTQDVAAVMEKYIEMKSKQLESKQAEKQAENVNQYSIKNCVDRLNTMEVSKQEKVKALKVFKNEVNRELFLCVDVEIALDWLRNEME